MTLSMSESTLKRKLRKLGLSFSQIRDEVRMFLSKKLLIDTDMAINLIALNVGYAEHSAFNHAFHRLTNKSPTEFRRQ